MDSPSIQEDLYPLLKFSAPLTSNRNGNSRDQDADSSVTSHISPTSPAFSTSYRGQHLDTPYLDSPQTACTSPGWVDTSHIKKSRPWILQDPVTEPYKEGEQGFGSKATPGWRRSRNKKANSDGCWIQTRQLVSSLWSDWWLSEIACAIGSLICLVAILMILWLQNTHPLPQWPRAITLNSVVSALVTLTKALMAVSVSACLGQLKWTHFSQQKNNPLADFESLDSASRGASGSFGLLVHLNGRYLAALGAVIMVAGFPLSPITQQAISTSQGLVDIDGLATISRAQNYSYDTFNGLYEDENDYSYAEGSAIGAFYNGLYASYNQSFPYPAATCSTGNCTWPLYRSLGICVRLADLTSQLQKNPGNSCTESDCTNPGMFILPNGLSIGGLTRLNVTSLPLKPQEMSNGTEVQSLKTLAFPHVFNRVADIVLMYNYLGNVWRAYEAVFYYCIQEFSTEITDGSVQSSIINTWANDSDSNGIEPVEDFPITVLQAPDDIRLYNVNSTSMWAIRNFTNQVMTGQAIFDGVATYTTDFARAFSLLGGVLRDVKLPQQTTAPQQTSGGHLALEALMQNIATSLSNNIKTNTYPGTTEPVMGITHSWQISVHIRWLWLVPICAYVFLGFLFLWATMYRNRGDLPKWKTSSLPVLQAINDTARWGSGSSNRLSDFEERAKGLTVVLEKREAGWKLVRKGEGEKRSIVEGLGLKDV